MKKNVVLMVVLVFMMCLVLVGCGGKNDDDGDGSGNIPDGGNSTQADDGSGNAVSSEPIAPESGEVAGVFDESTRIYATKTSGYKVSLFVPDGWAVYSDELSEGEVSFLIIDNGKLSEETERITLFTWSQGHSDAKQTWDEYAEQYVNDLADGQYVTYGNNTYYANVGHPNSDNFETYYYEGIENPSLFFTVKIHSGHESLAEEVLASLTIG